MKNDILSQYKRIRDTLIAERNTITHRLKEIAAVLSDAPTHTTHTTVSRPAAAAPPAPRRGKLSAAGRARIIAASRAHWAKVRAEKAAKAAKVAPKAPVKASAPSKPAKNTITLREALLKLTVSKPRTRQELIDGLKTVGYHTNSKDVGNVMNRFLYGKTAIFKNSGGKFSQK